jgi:hypothetical protein
MQCCQPDGEFAKPDLGQSRPRHQPLQIQLRGQRTVVWEYSLIFRDTRQWLQARAHFEKSCECMEQGLLRGETLLDQNVLLPVPNSRVFGRMPRSSLTIPVRSFQSPSFPEFGTHVVSTSLVTTRSLQHASQLTVRRDCRYCAHAHSAALVRLSDAPTYRHNSRVTKLGIYLFESEWADF